MPHRVENIVRKGEIAISLVRQNAALCGNGLLSTKTKKFGLVRTESICRQSKHGKNDKICFLTLSQRSPCFDMSAVQVF